MHWTPCCGHRDAVGHDSVWMGYQGIPIRGGATVFCPQRSRGYAQENRNPDNATP